MKARIAAGAEAEGKCANCRAPRPEKLNPPVRGVNWTVTSLHAPPGCEDFLLKIIQATQQIYDLE